MVMLLDFKSLTVCQALLSLDNSAVNPPSDTQVALPLLSQVALIHVPLFLATPTTSCKQRWPIDGADVGILHTRHVKRSAISCEIEELKLLQVLPKWFVILQCVLELWGFVTGDIQISVMFLRSIW